MEHNTFKSNDGLLETSKLGNGNKQTRETGKLVHISCNVHLDLSLAHQGLIGYYSGELEIYS